MIREFSKLDAEANKFCQHPPFAASLESSYSAPMPPPSLPSHLSYKSSLVLIPTTAIQEPIQSIRRKHDIQFHRWPPHINLIYPFLSSPSSNALGTDGETALQTSNLVEFPVLSRIRKATRDIPPFTLRLSANPPGTFLHSKRNATVWLRPVDKNNVTTPDHKANPAGASAALLQLQTALQTEFSECNADTRPFNPHLSIGQASGAKAAESLAEEVRSTVEDFLARESKGSKDAIRPGDADLMWHVDRVIVIERSGYHNPFRIVGDIELGWGKP